MLKKFSLAPLALTSRDEEYSKFLTQICQAFNSNSPDREKIIDDLLKANLEKLDRKLIQILKDWPDRNNWNDSPDEDTIHIGSAIYQFGKLIHKFILGNRAINVDLAIASYQVALSVFKQNLFAEEWGRILNNLGNAYNDRIDGERADNLERAIEAYWQALQVFTREAAPELWARTKNNLGTTYGSRILGNRAENLEQAIATYCEALTVLTINAFPQDWARTQINLGNAYRKRIYGDRAENLEQAIAAYDGAIRVFDKENFPRAWAQIQNNLGNAYSDRILGDREENLERAITAYQQALQVLTPEVFPQAWAQVQNNLGTAYQSRFQGENLELAIAALNKALQVYRREAFPQAWAQAQLNLGNAYVFRTEGDKTENLERAIAAYDGVLQIYRQEAFPQAWAQAQLNLGIAYSKRLLGQKSENIALAIKAYNLALQIYSSEAFPQKNAEILFELGLAYRDNQEFVKAHDSFARAIATVESLRYDIAFGDTVKRKWAEQWNRLYQGMVQVCLYLGYCDRALEYVERSKARTLVETLANRNLKPKGEIAASVLDKLSHLRQELQAEQRRLDMAGEQYIAGQSQELPSRERLQQLQQQIDDLIQEKIKPIDPSFAVTQKIEAISCQEIQALLPKRAAIVEWYITDNCFLAFIITCDNLQVLTRDANCLNELMTWRDSYLQTYKADKREWFNLLADRLQDLGNILGLTEVLAVIPSLCSELILIPHRYLHSFPLHALPLEERVCLLDRFPNGVRYAPSSQTLQVLQTQQRPNFQNLFFVQNPTEDLVFADAEIIAISSYFPSTKGLAGQAATKTALSSLERLSDFNCLHFCCHGYFNVDSPLNSALLVAVSEPLPEPKLISDLNPPSLEQTLTLGEIFDLDLKQCRLVTLSACETGLTDFKSLSDEYVGLAGGFLYAGSSNVVSSLWTVNDFSSALLMIKFYQNLIEKNTIATALNKAQLWLRDLSKEEAVELLSNTITLTVQSRSKSKKKFMNKLYKRYFDRLLKKRPFANPYFWAAFTSVGA